ncbi:MAG: phospholipase D-like domain-containing protein [Flavobacteriales bacterium]
MKIILSTLVCLSIALLSYAQTDIADLRNNYNVGEVVTATGIVTNGAEMGSTVRYMQDGTAGIAVYIGSWEGFTEPQRGDEITVTGEITEFNGLLEIGPNLTAVNINSSGNTSPDFEFIDLGDFNEGVEGELVSFEGAQFVDGGSTFAGNSTYTFLHEGEQGIIYIRAGSVLEGTIIPAGQISLRGICSQFSFDGFGGYQLLPRDEEDLISDSSINLVSLLTQSEHTQNSITVNWLTDTPGSSELFYGTDPNNLSNSITGTPDVTSHEVTLTDLEPGTVYYVSAVSSNEDSSVESSVSSFVTISESSGEILVYFTGSVDTSVATTEEAIGLGIYSNDTIAAYIDRAQETLDLAVYNNNDATVMSAVNDAYERGVQIRYVSHGFTNNIGFGQLNSNIPILERQDDNGSGMHNKFVIIDANDADNCVLITGSTNFTTNGFVDDFNNFIIFQDQSICRGYQVEFEEMWGGPGPQPLLGNSKFGADKLNNTPKNYTVGGSPVEVYFSPTDGTTDAIEEAIISADSDLDFALLVLTRDQLAEAIAEEDNLFLLVARGMIEQTSGTGSDAQFLIDEGVDIESHEGVQYSLHHKYAIIDHASPESDPQVVTGSHNWSSSAENVNDENTVIVHDERIANLYYQEWFKRWSELTVGVEDINNAWEVRFFPNPVSDQLNLFVDNSQNRDLTVQLTDVTGKTVYTSALVGKKHIVPVTELSTGVYVLSILDGSSVYTEKIVVE